MISSLPSGTDLIRLPVEHTRAPPRACGQAICQIPAAITKRLITDTACRHHPTKHFEERNVGRTNVLQRGSRQLLVFCLAAIVFGLASASRFATTIRPF